MVQTKKPSVRGRRVSKAKILKGKYAAELEFSEGWNGSNQKTFCEGRRVSKAKILKGKYAAELEFSEGWNGSNQKTIIFSMCGLKFCNLLLYT